MSSKLDVFSPSQLFSDNPPDLSSRAFRFLAEGDSWFTIGTLNLLANSNLLFEMEFEQSACAINCASPGDTLKHMAQMNADRNFADLLFGRRARFWDAIILSCGGNDLIDAVGTPPVDQNGQAVPPELRLLLQQGEWGPPEMGAQRYLSDAGWQTFRTYVGANFDHMVAMRERGPSRGQPVFLHGYAFPTPRPAPAGLGSGPWLLPALQRYAVPDEDGILVAHELLKRLNVLLAEVAADQARFPHVHWFDSTAVPIDAALPHTEGVSGDWINEIHLTRAGYGKIARPWAAAIEATLAGG
jgi:lysophospholipase L1-like esterase